MKSRALMTCAFAGAILVTTLDVANSTALRSGVSSHYWHGHMARHMTAHHRGPVHRTWAWRTETRTVHRHSRHSIALRTHEREAPAGGAGSSGGGLLSGIASVYSGGRTANGEVARASALTAAHRTLPFGTMVKVTNTGTGRSVVVRINDRGPFVRGRVIDLTPAGASALGFSGLARVTLTVMGRG
jgi:rare lipoprotein A